MLSAQTLRVCRHEASHCASMIMLGYEPDLVSRTIHDAGLTTGCVTDREDRQVVLLAPVFVDPAFGGDSDVEQAHALGNTNRASDRAWKLVNDPRFRRLTRAIEAALVKSPTLDAAAIRTIMRGV